MMMIVDWYEEFDVFKLLVWLQELVKKYSEFINFPIFLWASKEVDVEVPADEDDSSDEEDEKCMCTLAVYTYSSYVNASC